MQAREQAIVDRVVDEEPAQRRAALAGRADRTKYRGSNDEIEIGIFGDDDGIISSELEKHSTKTSGDGLPD